VQPIKELGAQEGLSLLVVDGAEAASQDRVRRLVRHIEHKLQATPLVSAQDEFLQFCPVRWVEDVPRHETSGGQFARLDELPRRIRFGDHPKHAGVGLRQIPEYAGGQLHPTHRALHDVLEVFDGTDAQAIGDGLAPKVLGHSVEREVGTRIEGRSEPLYDLPGKRGLAGETFREIDTVSLCGAEGGLTQDVQQTRAATAGEAGDDQRLGKVLLPAIPVPLDGDPIGVARPQQIAVMEGPNEKRRRYAGNRSTKTALTDERALMIS